MAVRRPAQPTRAPAASASATPSPRGRTRTSPRARRLQGRTRRGSSHRALARALSFNPPRSGLVAARATLTARFMLREGGAAEIGIGGGQGRPGHIDRPDDTGSPLTARCRWSWSLDVRVRAARRRSASRPRASPHHRPAAGRPRSSSPAPGNRKKPTLYLDPAHCAAKLDGAGSGGSNEDHRCGLLPSGAATLDVKRRRRHRPASARAILLATAMTVRSLPSPSGMGLPAR